MAENLTMIKALDWFVCRGNYVAFPLMVIKLTWCVPEIRKSPKKLLGVASSFLRMPNPLNDDGCQLIRWKNDESNSSSQTNLNIMASSSRHMFNHLIPYGLPPQNNGTTAGTANSTTTSNQNIAATIAIGVILLVLIVIFLIVIVVMLVNNTFIRVSLLTWSTGLYYCLDFLT